MELQFQKDGKTAYKVSYPLLKRNENSAERKGFISKDVIYLITPDRFANGNASNDEVVSMKEGIDRVAPGGRHGGDLEGVIKHLDYIEDMGFTQIWLNPVLENNMQEYSYHGYSTADYYQVDPRYGNNELYLELSQKAQQKGIGLIKDIILNHIGSEHWWMSDMPAHDWINHGGKFVGTTHLREALHDPYAPESSKRGHADGWFVPTMPDLNQRNPLLATYLIQNSIWWIEYAGLSGVRLDTYSYPDKAFLSEWNRRIMQEYPNLNVVGEEWTDNLAITSYWQKGSNRYDDYDSELPSVFDFALQTATVSALNEEENWNSGWIKVYRSLANDFLFGNPNNLVTFPDNHDMSRIYSQLNKDLNKTKLAFTLFATTRGIPQVYYGTEILMDAVDDHGKIRMDMPGGWENDRANAFTGQGLSKDKADMQRFVKTLLNYRKQSSEITAGKLMHYPPKNGIYVYFRYLEGGSGKRVMVILNKAQPQTLSIGDFAEVLSASGYNAINVFTGEKINNIRSLNIPENAATVLELSPRK